MVADGVDTESALNMLKQKRQADYEATPFYQKAGQAVVGTGIGALTTAGKVTNNLFDFTAQKLTGYTGFGEEAKKYEEAQKIAENTPGQ